MGIGETSVIDEYLAETTYSVGEFTGSMKRWEITLVPGLATAAGTRLDEPAAKLIRASSATGDPAALKLVSKGSPITLVLMRSDALSPVAADLSLNFKVPQLVITMWSALSLAVLLIPAALALIWVAIFHLRRRGRHE
ncbi:MAG: hypothetical protein CK552_05810 [Actinobacteria bacterium]|nr:MAG: hypothetical protein CK552_05810 [Actinomycetota bacterium]